MTSQEKQFLNFCIDFKKELIPYETNLEKVRIGEDGDGGYVICDIPSIKYDALYSYGSDDNISFEKSFYKKYKVDSFVYDHTINGITNKPDYINFFKQGVGPVPSIDLDTVNNHIQNNSHTRCKNLIMQMDIEGHEWGVLNSADLSQFAQIIIEYHMPSHAFSDMIDIIKKVNKSFTCVHIHGNNCLLQPWFDHNLPRCFEVSYVRNDLISKKSQNDWFITV